MIHHTSCHDDIQIVYLFSKKASMTWRVTISNWRTWNCSCFPSHQIRNLSWAPWTLCSLPDASNICRVTIFCFWNRSTTSPHQSVRNVTMHILNILFFCATPLLPPSGNCDTILWRENGVLPTNRWCVRVSSCPPSSSRCLKMFLPEGKRFWCLHQQRLFLFTLSRAQFVCLRTSLIVKIRPVVHVFYCINRKYVIISSSSSVSLCAYCQCRTSFHHLFNGDHVNHVFPRTHHTCHHHISAKRSPAEVAMALNAVLVPLSFSYTVLQFRSQFILLGPSVAHIWHVHLWQLQPSSMLHHTPFRCAPLLCVPRFFFQLKRDVLLHLFLHSSFCTAWLPCALTATASSIRTDRGYRRISIWSSLWNSTMVSETRSSFFRQFFGSGWLFRRSSPFLHVTLLSILSTMLDRSCCKFCKS